MISCCKILQGVRLATKFEGLVTADGRFEVAAKRHLGMVVFRLRVSIYYIKNYLQFQPFNAYTYALFKDNICVLCLHSSVICRPILFFSIQHVYSSAVGKRGESGI
jgi:hypothetical protein